VYGYSDAKVKIIPSNQTLILAGEPAGRRSAADTLFDQASRLVAGGPELKRVTILAARLDSTVLVRADYFSGEESPSADSQPTATQQTTSTALTVLGSSAGTLSGPVANSSYRNPMQLYARTQHGVEDAKALVDVFA
jgi:hypothetical protein